MIVNIGAVVRALAIVMSTRKIDAGIRNKLVNYITDDSYKHEK